MNRHESLWGMVSVAMVASPLYFRQRLPAMLACVRVCGLLLEQNTCACAYVCVCAYMTCGRRLVATRCLKGELVATAQC